MNNNQIDIFQVIREQELDAMVPELEIGQTIYQPILDTVREWKVDEAWKGSCYIYGLHDGRSHSTLAGYNIGVTYFKTYEEAQQVASQDMTETIIPELTDYVGWSAIRKTDNHKLKYIVAKVGEKQLYWKQGITYTFLDTFESKTERDQRYREEVKKIIEEANRDLDPKEEIFETEKLYKVDDKQYASLDFASRHKHGWK